MMVGIVFSIGVLLLLSGEFVGFGMWLEFVGCFLVIYALRKKLISYNNKFRLASFFLSVSIFFLFIVMTRWFDILADYRLFRMLEPDDSMYYGIEGAANVLQYLALFSICFGLREEAKRSQNRNYPLAKHCLYIIGLLLFAIWGQRFDYIQVQNAVFNQSTLIGIFDGLLLFVSILISLLVIRSENGFKREEYNGIDSL